jgi:hypothetical protein
VIRKEWAIIAAINGGEIALMYRAVRAPEIEVAEHAWNERIYEAGLKTQNYDRGLGRLVWKFDSASDLTATFAVSKGVHNEHGVAVHFAQGSRRCLLLDTLYGLSDEEAMWYTLQFWARFQPRLNSPRTSPEKLFFPAEYTPMFSRNTGTVWRIRCCIQM